MDKNAIKKFSIWARRELISRVSQRAAWYGITEQDPIDEKATALHGVVLTPTEQAQRRALIARIRKEGYTQVMEEVAYTWFNRFIALRFMEVNGYLPSYVRVFSDENGAFNPQILAEAIHLDFEGLDMDKVYAMEEANEKEPLFKYLVIAQCNDLNRMLPGMFQKISDHTELLFPDFLLREGSVIEQMVTTIPEDDWKDAVQIIGWLYQYYNAEPKDEVFAALKKNIKISKEKIPAATQLFTPDWIVRYMVENSLGRLWVEGHPNDELKASWKYYLEEAPQEPEVEAQLKAIRAEYAQLDPASILCADPCMGSGHILVYMFDVLMQIYLSYGYTTNEAVESIVRNNLWGLDIDDRAAQLAYFAVMMKARQYDRRWLAKQVRNPIQPNVFALQDSGDWSTFERQMKAASEHHPSLFADPAIKTAKALFEAFADAKEFGSIIQPEVTLEDLTLLENTLDEMQKQADLLDFVAQADAVALMETLKPLIRQARGLMQKYHAVVTNPPYMGSASMGSKLSEYVRVSYPDSKSDLFAIFIERIWGMVAKSGYQAMITQQTWMFLSSFDKLRKKIQAIDTINMAHLGSRAFEEIGGEVVQTTAFVLQNIHISEYKGIYCRLIEPTTQQGKEDTFLSGKNRYIAQQDNFSKIPGCPVAYWVSLNSIDLFESRPKLSDFFIGRVGLMTTDNDKFLRFFWEVEQSHICFTAQDQATCALSGKKYFPHNKGGSFRKWAGNRDYVVDWENNGERIKNTAIAKYPYLNGNPNFVVHDDGYYFRENVSWSEIAMSNLAFRYYPEGFTFNVKGMSAFPQGQYSLYDLIAFCNSIVCAYYARIINPSISFGVNSFANIPFVAPPSVVRDIAKQNIALSCEDWDSFETSWDFQRHPLVVDRREYRDQMELNFNAEARRASVSLISKRYERWEWICEQRFQELKANEEELNRIFIDIYGLQNELTPEVADKDVTVRKADLGRDIRSLISYAVGCMMGRYSLDREGLVLAGQKFTDVYAHNPEGYLYGDLAILEGDYLVNDAEKKDYTKCSFAPDRDGILPITDDEYFDDDIVGRFVEWVRTVFGAESLEDNLKYIADALGGKGSPREVIRQYFLNDFYKDHLKVYQKRPIYWLFDAGKKNSFKCLIYMHRYQPDTIARIRTDYVHETQARYRTAIETLERQLENASTSERVKLQKRLAALKAQAEELRIYEEKIHHLADQMIPIDLDDGVKVNYAKFADVLAPIK